MDKVNSYHPKNKDEWRAWLRENHIREQSVWLIFNKKSSSNPNLSWSEAVDNALCFGWIDSTKKTIDDEQYMQYFCKRKAQSNWSKINKEKVAYLLEQGLMAEAGIKSVELAKENGSWYILDQVEALIIPEDLNEALAKINMASEYFGSLKKSIKKGLLYWVISAKRKDTRQKRINEIVRCANQETVPKQFR